MTSYAPACDPQTIRSDLLSALDAYDSAHRKHEEADQRYRGALNFYKDCLSAITAEVIADKEFSNETKRKLEIERRINERWPVDVENVRVFEWERHKTQAELERAEAHVKTLRAVLYFDAEQMRLRAEVVAANRLAASIEHVGGLGDSDDDLPL